MTDEAARDAEIRSAATRWGVPYEDLKAMILAESAGDWETNRTHVNIRSGYNAGRKLWGYIGMFEDGVRSLGVTPELLDDNHAVQVDTLARYLKQQFAEIGERTGELVYLLGFEGDYIFANAEPYRTIRDSIVARAN